MTIQENLQSLWEQKFDKIYVLSYIPYKKLRFDKMVEEFTRAGIYNAKNFEIVYTTDLKFYHNYYKLSRYSRSFNKDYFIKSVGIFKASLEHYRVIKTSYDLGYNRICIFEDDVRFLKDLNKVYEILNALPDYDICLGDCMFGKTKDSSNKRVEYSKKSKINDYWAKTNNYKPVWFASCYMLNRNGMKHIYTSQEEHLRVPDRYTYTGGNVSRAYAINNICIQNDTKNSLTGARVFFERYRKNKIEPNDYNI